MKQLLLCLLVLTLVSCGKKEEEAPKPPAETAAQWLAEALDLDKAIVKTPPEIVSTTAPLDLYFRDPVVPGHMAGTVLDKNPFEFEPAVEGRAKWITQRQLRFIPDGRLPAGRAIEGTLHGKVAFGEQKNVNDFHFSFKVAEQEVLSYDAGFVAAPEEKNSVRYVGTITFAEPVDVEAVGKDLALSGPSGRVEVKVTRAETPSEVSIRSGIVTRTQQGKEFTLSLPARYTAGGETWEQAVFLPGIDVFRVLAHMDMTEEGADKPTYAFRFNDPIKKDVDLSGYVTVEPAVEYDMRTRDKYLLLHGDFQPGIEYTITIAENFPSVFGTKTQHEYTDKFSLSNVKPEVVWLDDGVFLPTSNEYKLQFKSVNVRRVRVAVWEIFPQNIGFFIQSNQLVDRSDEARRLGRSRFGYRDLPRVGEEIYNQVLDITQESNRWVKTQLDLTPVFEGKKNSVFTVRLMFDINDLVGTCTNDRGEAGEGVLYYEASNYYENPCQYGYYYSRGSMEKLLISSDIGLTVKKAEDGLHVFATDVLTARPVKGLSLGLYTAQNRLVATKRTDGDGYVHFEEDGSYVLGSHSSGIALLNERHPSWQLSNFDVGGGAGGQKGIDVFMYTDRGVHRPGDTVHLAAIVRTNRSAPPERQPILLEVKDPRGQVVHRARTNSGPNGHVYFPIETSQSDPTGNWLAELQVADEKFTKVLRIEMAKPNRLKVEVEVPEKIPPGEESLEGTITCRYLFGAPGANLEATVKVALAPRDFRADDYRDFIFTSPLRKLDPRTQEAFAGKLNADGVASFDWKLPDLGEAPGLVRAEVKTRVYEKGGSVVEHGTATTIYPFTAFAGVKSPFEYGSARVGENYALPVIAVNDEGKPVAGHRIRVTEYVNRSHWWWHYDQRDRKDFRRMSDTYHVATYTYQSTSIPIMHQMSVEDYGQHFIEVADLTSGHETGLFFYASEWGRPPGEEAERNYLQITSNENVYNVGDQVTLSFDTPSEGMALFTLEQGRRILGREWKPVSAGQTTFSFELTEETMPNCYATISLIQPHNQNTNDLPMRLYGLKTLYVEDVTSRLPLEMTAPEELRPKQEFTVDVTSRAPEPATYTIAVVDDGLLDLTGFVTPSPWDHFFEKIRLGVATTDNYDEIIGVLFPDIDRYFSIGGGVFAEIVLPQVQRRERTEAQRFKPAVLFAKPITIRPGKTVKTPFTMPNYVGSVRIMVVGASGHSYASLEQTVPVKQELMLLPTVPRVARPGDRFSLPVSVFANDDAIDKVNVSLELSANLTAEGPRSIQVPFEKPGEQDIAFSVQVGDAVGADTATVLAVSGRFNADYAVHLPVLSPNPHYTEVTDTMVSEGAPVTLVPVKFGLEGTNAAKIAFSRMPDIQMDKRFSYLIRYPYGCLEQAVSSAFPQIFLPHLAALEPHQERAVTDNINATIEKLARYQMASGFSFWPGSGNLKPLYSDWGTTYAGHFLVEARELGYNVPDGLYNHWLEDAKKNAKKVNRKNHRYQAYRLFVLALAGESQVGAMNLLRENYLGEMDPLSRMLLATSYYLSAHGQAAREIMTKTSTEVPKYREMSGTYGSAIRDQALMTYLAVRMNDKQTASILLRGVAKAFHPWGWYSTQETAMALLSMGTYYRKMPIAGGAVKFELTTGEEPPQTILLSEYQKMIELPDMWDKKITIESQSDNPLFVSLFVEGVPLDSRIRTEHYGVQMTRSFYDEEGQPVDVGEQPQGAAFWVIYEVTSVYASDIEELALSSVFPSGWEIVNLRLTGEAPPDWVNKAGLTTGDYMDIRDDRVNWFFDLDAGRAMKFGVKINPTFKGTYTLPPVALETMYSPDFYARIEGGTVSVK
jgi:uncharacterized protein YfaS (alpha-2-macroglobulin family)